MKRESRAHTWAHIKNRRGPKPYPRFCVSFSLPFSLVPLLHNNWHISIIYRAEKRLYIAVHRVVKGVFLYKYKFNWPVRIREMIPARLVFQERCFHLYTYLRLIFPHRSRRTRCSPERNEFRSNDCKSSLEIAH